MTPAGKERANNMNSYRGIDFEIWKDGGFIVCIQGDEIYCETMEAVERLIDDYLE